jgi:3-methyladenine DNA glycosylase AlkC
MAEPLKNLISPAFVATISEHFQTVYPPFDQAIFAQKVFDADWPQRELKQRIRHLAMVLQQVLPDKWPQSLDIVVAVSDHLVAKHGEKLTFEYGFLNDFVEITALEDLERAIPAFERITRWTSAEFAIRPFIQKYPERMLQQMMLWSKHPSPMVRRLSCEGFRPRLPWGMGVPMLKKDPTPLLPMLENLKNDPAETVRRSVANHLNDISKDHPALALQMAERWQGQQPETDWVVRHALRGLLKKGNAQALQQYGYEQDTTTVALTLLHCDTHVALNGQLNFSVLVKNTATTPQKFRLEYAIHYLTGSGKISRKVFLLRHIELEAGTEIVLEKYQRFVDYTTRKHFSGKHQLEILVNGKPMATTSFDVA